MPADAYRQENPSDLGRLSKVFSPVPHPEPSSCALLSAVPVQAWDDMRTKIPLLLCIFPNAREAVPRSINFYCACVTVQLMHISAFQMQEQRSARMPADAYRQENPSDPGRLSNKFFTPVPHPESWCAAADCSGAGAGLICIQKIPLLLCISPNARAAVFYCAAFVFFCSASCIYPIKIRITSR